MPYLVDANVFIEAKNIFYSMVYEAKGARHVKISNVCVGLVVKSMTPYEMLRLEGARFVFGSAGSGAEAAGNDGAGAQAGEEPR